MANVTLKVDENGYITELVPDSDANLSFDGIIAFCMSVMESSVKDYLKHHPDSIIDLYDALDVLFYKFMQRAFPEGTQPRDFDLSDAGLLYAQDMIIDDAAKRGITYDEALKEYEEKAKKYVREKGRKAS